MPYKRTGRPPGRPKKDNAPTTPSEIDRSADGRGVAVMLTNHERDTLRNNIEKNEFIKAYVTMILDVQQKWTLKQIADKLNTNVKRLHYVRSDPDFIQYYNEQLNVLKNDPHIDVARGMISDLMYTAVDTLKAIMVDPRAAATARHAAATTVLEMGGISMKERPRDDSHDLEKFLTRISGTNVSINSTTINIQEIAQAATPEGFLDAVILPPDTPKTSSTSVDSVDTIGYTESNEGN